MFIVIITDLDTIGRITTQPGVMDIHIILITVSIVIIIIMAIQTTIITTIAEETVEITRMVQEVVG